jgi:hypothetical protein
MPTATAKQIIIPVRAQAELVASKDFDVSRSMAGMPKRWDAFCLVVGEQYITSNVWLVQLSRRVRLTMKILNLLTLHKY